MINLTCRSNTKIGVRVDECEGSNPSSCQESLTGGVNYSSPSIVFEINEYFLNEVSIFTYKLFSDKRKKKKRKCYKSWFHRVVEKVEQALRTKGYLAIEILNVNL